MPSVIEKRLAGESGADEPVALPDDLPEAMREPLLALGKPCVPRPAAFPIDEQLIGHWCEALEDGNPLYLDEDFARARGFARLKAPPITLFAATAFPFRWPWPPREGESPALFAQVKRILGLPVGIAASSEMQFFGAAQAGERLSTDHRLLSVSAWQRTRLGEGRFIAWAHGYRNPRGERIAEQRVVLFAYGRGLGGEEELSLAGGYSNTIEEVIEGRRTGYCPSIGADRYWEDVSEGEALPEIRMPITMTRCVFMASATRDFSPQHSNPDYAKNRSKTRDVFVNTQFNMGMVSRLATDWGGPAAELRRVKILMKENVCAGDEMIVTGRVTRKYVEGGEHRVDIAVTIANQDHPATPAEATVALPSRTNAGAACASAAPAPEDAPVELPEGIDEAVVRELRALGRESEILPGPFPIGELMVRHWCETLEDGNPLYLDEDFARARGLRAPRVPPIAIYPATVFPFRWPWPPKDGYPEMVLYRVKRLLGLPVGIVSSCEMHLYRPVLQGDRVGISSRLLSLSPWKRTRLGEGHFITYAVSYWNEARAKVAEMRVTLFIYGRGLGGEEELALAGGYSNAIEEVIEGRRTGYRPTIGADRYWEAVSEGEALPEIRMPITMTRCVFMASATRDFSPQHSNPEYAKNRSRTRDVFVNTQFNMGMVSRLATDWGGPSAELRRVKILMKENVCAGDEMIVSGRVTRKYVEAGEHRVDIAVVIANQDHPATPAEATVALPSRGA